MADAEDAALGVHADGGRDGICRHALEDTRAVVLDLAGRECEREREERGADLVVEEVAPRIRGHLVAQGREVAEAGHREQRAASTRERERRGYPGEQRQTEKKALM